MWVCERWVYWSGVAQTKLKHLRGARKEVITDHFLEVKG
jgi:hypothetical protein